MSSEQPLSLKEEAELRRSVAWLEERSKEWAGRVDVMRLLDTIDALRAAHRAQVAGVELVIGKLERFSAARAKDVRDNRDAPDNINELIARLTAVWADMLRRAHAVDPARRSLDGRAVHREWRDGMLAQGRHVAPERMAWETLSAEDKALDEWIAARLVDPRATELREAAEDVVLQRSKHHRSPPIPGTVVTSRKAMERLETALAAVPREGER